jgi:hypothetical protein
MRVPLGTLNRYFPPLSVFSAHRRDFEKSERSTRLGGENLQRWQLTRKRDDRMLKRRILSAKRNLEQADIYSALRIAGVDNIKRTRWWQTLSTRTDTRASPDDAPMQGRLYAVACSLEHEDLLRANDTSALLDAPGLDVLGDRMPLYVHEINARAPGLSYKCIAVYDVLWSAVRRDGMTAWVMLDDTATPV